MDFQTRWIGEVKPGHQLEEGELAVCVNGATTYLCLRIGMDVYQGGVVLAEYGPDSGNARPYLVDANALIEGLPVRLLSGDLVIAPLSIVANEMFKPTGDLVQSGWLGLLEDGSYVIRVSQGPGSLTFDLKTGKSLHALPNVRVWIADWRLLWVFGDEEMELCRFGAPAP